MSDDEWIFDPAYQIEGFDPAGGSSTIGQRVRSRGKHCHGANNTCAAFKAKGTDFCVGHLRSQVTA